MEKQIKLYQDEAKRIREEAERRDQIEKEAWAKKEKELSILLMIGLVPIVIGFIVAAVSPSSSSGPSTGIVIGALFFWAGVIVLIVRHFRKP